MTAPSQAASDAGGAVRVADLRLLAPAMCGWVCVAVVLPAPQATLVEALALVALATAVLLWRSRRRSGVDSARRSLASALALCLAATALVLLATLLQRGLRAVGPISKLAQEGASVRLRADVASDPVLLPARGNRRTPLVMVRLQVHQVIGRGASSAVGTPVLAFADPSWAGLRWGAEVEVRGRLAPARRGDDVVATLSGKGVPTVRAPPGAVQRAAGALRFGLQRAVQGAPGEGAGLLPGLVVGDTSHLDPGLEQDMRTAGLTHLVAVSGSNVGE
jgi:competence protein ComEC